VTSSFFFPRTFIVPNESKDVPFLSSSSRLFPFFFPPLVGEESNSSIVSSRVFSFPCGFMSPYTTPTGSPLSCFFPRELCTGAADVVPAPSTQHRLHLKFASPPFFFLLLFPCCTCPRRQRPDEVWAVVPPPFFPDDFFACRTSDSVAFTILPPFPLFLFCLPASAGRC